MVASIYEFFGYDSTDSSPAAARARVNQECPFIGSTCVKRLRDGQISGVCTLKPVTTGPVICCPIRLYAEDYKVLKEVARRAFGDGFPLLPSAKARTAGEPCVAVFGQRWGGELRLPQRSGEGSYFVDYILARLDAKGHLQEFVAVEVQSIDTTGNYRDGINALRANPPGIIKTSAGFNWENVNKRILPQIIYKGHVLQREALCTKGLFFICPTPVYEKIIARLGGAGALQTYPLQSSSLTFMWWDLDLSASALGRPIPLVLEGSLTTNTNQVALAFSAPANLPPQGVYESAIRNALE